MSGPIALRALFALALVPLATGRLIVTYQDALMTHLPAKSATVERIRAGEIPFVNPYASCGQPLLGNPNFATFFPDTLLFLVLPLPAAFGLHFALAAALGFIGARRWARASGFPRGAAEAAGFAFVFSGVFVSAWRFYNSGMALAVAPWVMAAVAKLTRRAEAGDRRTVRRAAAELGLWGGLEVLAGEPVVALLTFVLAGARVAWWLFLPVPGKRLGALSFASGLALAALLAAPQIATTAQMFEGSRRSQTPYLFAVATYNSTHPARLLEQAVPFPFGRPDLVGAGGFREHRFFDNHAPYLWSLHLGWVPLALLLLFGRSSPRGEGFWLGAAGVSFLLSLGQHLPGAKRLYPFLSLDGRLRFPVKWWYVVGLCLVPLLAGAVRRWEEGSSPSRHSRYTLPAFVAAALAVAATRQVDGAAFAALLASGAALVAILAPVRSGGGRDARLPAWCVAGSLFVAHLPFFLAVLDRPPGPPPLRVAGRVFERLSVEAHPPAGSPPTSERTTREFFRRARPELWALTGALSGIAYAFDYDPDGSYADHDRIVRKALDAMAWPERAAGLRSAGASHVVTSETLPPPYREMSVLNRAHGVRLYALDGPAPSLRMREATGRTRAVEETADRLVADVEAPAAGVVIWSRSYFPAWRAWVDGAPSRTVVADRHLVGVPVPAGSHRVHVRWSAAPLAVGAGLFAAGLAGALLLLSPGRAAAASRG